MRLVRQSFAAALVLSLAVLSTGCPDDGYEPLAPLPDGGAPDARAVEPSPDAAVAPSPDAAVVEPAPDAAPGCSPWTVDVNGALSAGEVSARVEDGVLVLSSRGDDDGTCFMDRQGPCADIKVYQKKLVGDFDVTVEVEGISGGDAFEGVDLFLVAEDSTDIFGANRISILGGDRFRPQLSFSDGRSSESHGASTTRATLRARRADGFTTLTASAGGNSLGRQVVIGGDPVVGIALNGGDSTHTVSARILSFTVTGGGGQVVSDEFDCDATLR